MNFDNGYLSVNILSPNTEIGRDFKHKLIGSLFWTTSRN